MNPPQNYLVTKAGYEISTERDHLNVDVIHGYLERSYWSPGVPRRVVETAIEHSLCFGLYAIDQSKASTSEQRKQIGFARVVTDFARFAYISDVFILPSEQGKGLGTWLMQAIVDCPMLVDVGWTFLATRDAHGLYEKVGFTNPPEPRKLMSKYDIKAWYNPEMAETFEG